MHLLFYCLSWSDMVLSTYKKNVCACEMYPVETENGKEREGL